MSVTKERLHQLVEELTDEELPAAERILEELRAARHDPLLRALLEAPLDDEPVIDADRAAIAASESDIAAGRVVSHQEIRREFGL